MANRALVALIVVIAWSGSVWAGEWLETSIPCELLPGCHAALLAEAVIVFGPLLGVGASRELVRGARVVSPLMLTPVWGLLVAMSLLNHRDIYMLQSIAERLGDTGYPAAVIGGVFSMAFAGAGLRCASAAKAWVITAAVGLLCLACEHFWSFRPAAG